MPSALPQVIPKAVTPMFKPIEVTFAWDEVQADRSTVRRSHTQLVEKVPFRYVIHVGGTDRPVVRLLRVNLRGAAEEVKSGYSDGRDVGGKKWRHRWVTVGRNLLEGRPYTLSVPPTKQWGGDDPKGEKLTDGVVGPPYAGGGCPKHGLAWNAKSGRPEITVGIGRAQARPGRAPGDRAVGGRARRRLQPHQRLPRRRRRAPVDPHQRHRQDDHPLGGPKPPRPQPTQHRVDQHQPDQHHPVHVVGRQVAANARVLRPYGTGRAPAGKARREDQPDDDRSDCHCCPCLRLPARPGILLPPECEMLTQSAPPDTRSAAVAERRGE